MCLSFKKNVFILWKNCVHHTEKGTSNDEVPTFINHFYVTILNNDLQHVNENVEKIKSLSTIDNNAIEADVVWNTNPISRAMYGEATGTATYYGTDTSNALIPLHSKLQNSSINDFNWLRFDIVSEER